MTKDECYPIRTVDGSTVALQNDGVDLQGPMVNLSLPRAHCFSGGQKGDLHHNELI